MKYVLSILLVLWGCSSEQQYPSWSFTSVDASSPDSMQSILGLNPTHTLPSQYFPRDSGIQDTGLLSWADGSFVSPPSVEPITEPCRYWLVDIYYALHRISCTAGIGSIFHRGIGTPDGYLFPEPIKEIAARDSTTLWVVTTSSIWAVGLEDAVAVRSTSIRRADWKAAYFDSTLERLILIDSTGEVYQWTELEGLEELSTLNYNRTTHRVYGDATFNKATGRPAILLWSEEGTQLFHFDPLTGETEAYPSILGFNPKGLSFSAGYLWATTVGLSARVDPITGSTIIIHITASSGNFSSSER